VLRDGAQAVETQPVVAAQVRQRRLLPPGLVHAVGQEPLVEERGDTLVARAGDHLPVGLAVGEGVA